MKCALVAVVTISLLWSSGQALAQLPLFEPNSVLRADQLNTMVNQINMNTAALDTGQAASCPDITGIWDITAFGVRYTPSTNSFTYTGPDTGVLSITSQNGCLFYGDVVSGDGSQLTGALTCRRQSPLTATAPCTFTGTNCHFESPTFANCNTWTGVISGTSMSGISNELFHVDFFGTHQLQGTRRTTGAQR